MHRSLRAVAVAFLAGSAALIVSARAQPPAAAKAETTSLLGAPLYLCPSRPRTMSSYVPTHAAQSPLVGLSKVVSRKVTSSRPSGA